MGKYKCTFQDKENLAYAIGRDLSISPRHSIEICTAIRHQKIARAKAFLKNVANLDEAVPFRKFKFDLGHKPGTGPGRYPVNAAKAILAVVESAEANAKFKDMNVENLYIAIAVSQKAPMPFRFGRHSRRKAKRSHIEIAVKEAKKVEKAAKVETKESKDHAKETESKAKRIKND